MALTPCSIAAGLPGRIGASALDPPQRPVQAALAVAVRGARRLKRAGTPPITGSMAANAQPIDPTEHPQWDELYAEAVAMRVADGERAPQAEIRAVFDVVGFLRATGAILTPD